MAASSRFSISATISMIDKVSPNMGKAARSVTGFSQRMRNQFKRADISANRINKSINRIGGRAAKIGLGGLAIGAGLVARQFVQFDDAIFGATARFKAAEKPGADMTKVMEDLRIAARKTGAQTQFTATQAAQALDKFALAGFTSQESIASLRSQIDLTTATGEDFMRVADISSDLLGAFGGASLESAQKVKMLKNMNAQLAIATVSANVTMEDLFETLKVVAPIGKTVGASMSDMIATTALLGSSGIKGSLAATAMKNIFQRLVKPTKDVEDGLSSIGLGVNAFVNNQGKMKSMSEIFKIIGERTKGLTAVAKGKVFAQIFGARAFAGAANIQRNIKGITATIEKMGKDPQKQLAELSNFMRQSLGNRIKILGSAFQELGFKIISAFAGPGKDAISRMTKSIQGFDPTPIVNTLKIIIGVIKFLAPSIPIILGLVLAFKAYSAALAVAAVAQVVLNTAMSANVIALIVIGIAALVTSLIWLKANWNLVALTWKIKANEISQSIGLLDIRLLKFLSKIPGVGRLFKESLSEARGEMFKLVKEGQALKGIRAQVETGKLSDDAIGGLLNGGGVTDFASPQSQGITNTNNNNTTGSLDVNFNNAPAGTNVKQKGQMPPGMTLNTGVEGG